MNRADALALITYLNRAGLVGAMEGQAAVWADALADIRTTDAQDVARAMARTRTSAERWVTPGDVREAVGRLRTDRVMRGRVHVGHAPAQLDSPGLSEFHRVSDQLLADGHDPESARTEAAAAAVEHQNRQVEA